MTTTNPTPLPDITYSFSVYCGRFVLSGTEMQVRTFLHQAMNHGLKGYEVQITKSWLDGCIFITVTGPRPVIDWIIQTFQANMPNRW